MHLYLQPDLRAQMAELVDALDSKSGYRKVVQVRFLFWAQATIISPYKSIFCKVFLFIGEFEGE